MSTFTIKELMVPLSEYATVQEGATLFEAVLALEKVQEEYDHIKYRHRAVLVLDKNNRVAGKLSHLDVLRAIENQPDGEDSIKVKELNNFGFSRKFMRTLVSERRHKNLSLRDLCKIVSKVRVDKIMQAPTEGEYVEPETTLELAIHQMVIGDHFSLLVARNKEIVGVLRLSDVFAAIFHTMKECESDDISAHP
jgi:CBS domain-containing protein